MWDASACEAFWEAPLGLALFDAELRYTRVNAALAAMNGVSPEQHIGRTVLEVLPDLAPQLVPHLERVRDGGAAADAEVAGTTPREPRVRHHFRVSLYPLREGGRVTGVGAVVVDITGQERALREARHAAELLEMGDALLELDRDWRIVRVNANQERLSRRSRSETLGKLFWEVWPELANPGNAYWREYHRCMELRIPVKFDEYYAPLQLWTDVTGYPTQEGGVAVYFRDVSAEKQHELALRRERDLTRAIADAAAEAIFVTDGEGRVTFANREALRMFGFAPGEIDGQVLHHLIHHHDPAGRPLAMADCVLQRIYERGEAVRDHEDLFFRKDGSPVPVACSNAPLELGGERCGSVLLVRDVTDRKRAEEQLRAEHRRKDEFLGMLSHELRNPLAPIRNSVYILNRKGASDEQARRARSVIERQVEHLTRLVDDLLDVTRIARGKIELRRERLDLRDLVRKTGEDHRSLMDDRGLAFAVELPEEQLWVNGDPTRLAQAIGNLLGNAAKFTARGGRVALSARAAGAAAEVVVRDTGAGIEPDLVARVFDPFVQADRTLARSSGGLGLGLALVKGLVELHGGSAAARSAGPGKGAELTLRLPLADAVVSARPAQGGNGSGAHAHHRLRVLVVDDNADAAESLAELAEMWGHEAEVAHDGPTALDKARARPPDVILCDIGLPGMDGYEVARTVRADAALGRTRLVAVSGYAQPEDLRLAAEAGFDQHVAKPPAPEELERLLE